MRRCTEEDETRVQTVTDELSNSNFSFSNRKSLN